MMKKLLYLAIFLMASGAILAGGKGKGKSNDGALRKSAGASYPQPFTLTGAHPRTTPPISTGYYIVDSEDEAPDRWRPNPADIADTNTEPALWRRIVSGPTQYPPEYWEANKSEGYRFFRNPANMTDSTNNAFAGPIPIGFPFYFNGVRYDSFYVSTNGYISLSNRRYFYDADGNRTIPAGSTTAYDPNRDDYNVRGVLGNGTGLDDPTADDFGYQYYAIGAASGVGTVNGGLRLANNEGNGGLASWTNNAPIIAPFFDDLQVSVFNNDLNQPDDFGRVYFKRSASADKIVIYFVNLCPIGAKPVPGGTINFPANIRPGTTQPYFSVNAQIVLNRLDSTVTFNYERFDGVVTVAGRPVRSERCFRDNSTIGVRGLARHVNYPPSGGAQTSYNQYTEYLHSGTVKVAGPAGSDLTTPASNLAIRFKQWKNTVRTYSLKYFVKDPNTGNFTKAVTAPNNYELLVGHPLLGAIQPVAIYQNLSNDIQGPSGVNFQEQQLNFRARFRIKNDIINDTIVYNRLICINKENLSDPNSGVRYVDASGNALTFDPNTMNGIPPYGFVEVKFPPYETNEFMQNQVGRFTVEVIAEPYVCSGGNLRDEWPFDDTTRVRLFGIKRLSSFNDDVNDFSVSRTEGPLPSVNKWVSIDAEVVDGDEATYNPPPPRGPAGSNPLFQINSPVIRVNRVTLGGAEPAAGAPTNGDVSGGGGDQLISFPIDMRNKKNSVLSFSYQRTGRPPGDDFPRGWSDQTMTGPEPRVIQDGNPATVVSGPDALVVEFANPSPDAYNNITNIPGTGWNNHPGFHGSKAVTDNPAYTIFGAGGFRRGFHPLVKDSALTRVEGLNSNIFDDGKDFEFYKVFVGIPDTIINSPNEGAKNFRFRIRVVARKHTNPPQPAEDNDDFFVDNVRILFPTETPDLEVASVLASWPYTITPASQATNIPIVVKVSNNSNIGAQSFNIAVKIQRREDADAGLNQFVYCRTQTVPFLPANKTVDLAFPKWNARLCQDGNGPKEYVISARLRVPGGDPLPTNDSTYSRFTLNFGTTFAVDPATPTGTNNVPEQAFTNRIGKGLNLEGYSSGGYSTAIATGADGGNSSGQIAMRFTITSQDTVYGFQAFFGGLNADILNTTFNIYRDAGGAPGQRVPMPTVIKRRGYDDVRKDIFYDEYTTYLLDIPVILAPGDYWVSVAQRGSEGFELGGAKSRMGMVTTNYGTVPVVGVSGTSLVIFKPFRKKNAAGDLINDNRFAFENTLNSGTWTPFTPTVGNPGYPHLTHTGTASGYNTFSRGSWIPLLRPYFGQRRGFDPPQYEADCESTIGASMTSFDGTVKRTGIELGWQTASEQNTATYNVERRIAGTADWNFLGALNAAGNSFTARSYSFFDANVVRGTTYQYRLNQVSVDGSCNYTNSIERTFDYADGLALDQNYPNPFSENTAISFSLPEKAMVKLEVFDMLGNAVRTIANQEMNASSSVTLSWNGRDNNGAEVSSGTYMYKLTVGETTLVRTMSIVK